MPADLITPENLSLELLREIYDDALMEVSIDDEHGFLRLKEEIVAKVTMHESKERLGIIAFYGIKEDTQRMDRLELANRINDQYVMVRACIENEGDLCFDYTIMIKGGVSRKYIAHATRQFLKLVPRAVSECDEDGVVE